jgi:predicted AAA+ superfamily ATPase
LDEIQYVPELVPALKRWIDRDRKPGSYILTGSQQWEVLHALPESLAGRVAFLELEGFSFAEMAFAWRTHAGAEADLVLERDGTLFPIEFKATAHPKPKDARGIQRFRETYPQARIETGLVLAPTQSVVRLSAYHRIGGQ